MVEYEGHRQRAHISKTASDANHVSDLVRMAKVLFIFFVIITKTSSSKRFVFSFYDPPVTVSKTRNSDGLVSHSSK